MWRKCIYKCVQCTLYTVHCTLFNLKIDVLIYMYPIISHISINFLFIDTFPNLVTIYHNVLLRNIMGHGYEDYNVFII